MKIIGAGMAGLLAASMLRRYEPEVYEAQPELPDNHGALLRFRTRDVAEASAQRFREVRVTKGVRWGSSVLSGPLSPIPAANLYSRKVTGRVLPRSVMSLEPSVRWIAPDDFTTALARGTRVHLGEDVSGELIRRWSEEGETIISTIPMPALMKIMGWETSARFPSNPIWSLRTQITHPSVEVYQTIYYPEAEAAWYRASITGNLLIIEFLGEPDARYQCNKIMDVLHEDFGIGPALFSNPEVHYQHYGKISPCDDDAERKAFIFAMTDQYGIYSLGRFGTWRQILLDDLVPDIKAIDQMISERSIYNRHRDHGRER